MKKCLLLCLVFIAGFFVAAGMTAASEKSGYFISVSADSSDRELNGRVSAQLHNLLQVEYGRPIGAGYDLSGDADSIAKAKDSGRYRIFIRYEKKSSGAIGLKIEDWSERVDGPQTLSYQIEPAGQVTQDTLLHKLIRQHVWFQRDRALVEDAILVAARGSSARLELNEAAEWRDSSTGRIIDHPEAVRVFKAESAKHRDFYLAAIEIAASVGLGAIGYNLTDDINARDWEYKFDWRTFRKKLITFEAAKFDDNSMFLNTPGHAISGAYFYLFARGSNFTSLESFLLGFAGSSLWEFLVEYRELLSINDQIFTPIGGFAIGEAMYQLGQFFAKSTPTLPNKILSVVFGTPARFNDWVSRNKPVRTGDVDRFGFNREAWHRFDIFSGLGFRAMGDAGRPETEIGFHTQIINIGNYGRPGVVNTFLSDTVFTELILKSNLGQEGLLDFLFFAKTVFAGYYRQNIERADHGALKGYSFFVGPATAYEHLAHRRADGVMDQIGVVNVLGTTIDFTFYCKGVRIRAVVDVYGNFSAVRSYAIDEYAKTHSLEGTKSVLAEQRYYYAFGITVAPRLTVEYGRFELGGELKYQYFDSIEGRDRRQSTLSNDFDLTDSRLGYKLWLAYTLPVDYVKVALSFEQLHRGGRIGDLSVQDLDTTIMGNMILVF